MSRIKIKIGFCDDLCNRLFCLCMNFSMHLETYIEKTDEIIIKMNAQLFRIFENENKNFHLGAQLVVWSVENC